MPKYSRYNYLWGDERGSGKGLDILLLQHLLDEVRWFLEVQFTQDVGVAIVIYGAR